jgi:hypothetical protein
MEPSRAKFTASVEMGIDGFVPRNGVPAAFLVNLSTYSFAEYPLWAGIQKILELFMSVFCRRVICRNTQIKCILRTEIALNLTNKAAFHNKLYFVT